MARSLTVLVVVLTVAATAALQQATGSSGSDVRVTAGETCKLKGTRYTGRTSQGKPFCFTVARTGKISEYAYGFRDSCGTGTARTTASNGIPVSSSGSFSATSSQSYFKGRISGATAKGTLRSKRTEYGFVPPMTCDSGVVRWSGRRAG